MKDLAELQTPRRPLAKQRVEAPPAGQTGPRSKLRKRRAEILAETAARLLAGDDPDEVVMPALYRALSAERIVDATLGFVAVEGCETMRLGFMHGFDPEMVQRCLRLDFGQAICGTVAATRQAMHVTNIQRSLDPVADLVRSAGISAYACEPLLVRGTLLGTLSFASRLRASFDAEDLIFFRAVAKQLAVARDRMARQKQAQRASRIAITERLRLSQTRR